MNRPEKLIDFDDLVQHLRHARSPYVLATVVRTVAVTAAKAGAKAIIEADGKIVGGWIGGGCARGAVLRAARQALRDGRPRLVSIQPEDLLKDLGVEGGQSRSGVVYAVNMCPSQGTMDIFIEPNLPRPELVIMGATPVAVALASVAGVFDFAVTVAAPEAERGQFAEGTAFHAGFELPPAPGERYIIVATQGAGDLAALNAALDHNAQRVGFVGSRRKAARLREQLADKVSADKLAGLKAPAGLDIGAITPEEIALSILAELVAWRRQPQRAGSPEPEAG
ncbi:MAG: XdhC family protein [Hyphomicrobiales bacterium]|nr:XdhC family protein [Hyphomicrobiales bacterium]